MRIPFKFSKKIALRYLWSKRSEAFITIITIISVFGVAIGVTVINMVMAVMTGFEKELMEKITGANSHITVRHLTGKIDNWEEIDAKIKELKGIDSISPFTQHQALLRTRSHASGVLIRGIKPGTAASRQLASYLKESPDTLSLFNPPHLSSKNVDSIEDKETVLPGIVIGKELARTMGLYVGMPVSLLSPQVTSSPFGLIPRFRRFIVAGIYSSGLVEYESGLAYVSLEEAQIFFNSGKKISGLEIRVKQVEASSKATSQIRELLGGFESGYYAQDWTEVNRPLWEAINLEKRVYFIVLLLIVVMASFSIITTLVLLVLEKRKDIAVLKTLGASSRSVGLIFVIQGSLIGISGTVLGLIGGYLGCLALRKYGFPLDERIFQMSTVPVRMEFVNFAVVGVAAFAICTLATIYPALRASKLEPSEVLRYE